MITIISLSRRLVCVLNGLSFLNNGRRRSAPCSGQDGDLIGRVEAGRKSSDLLSLASEAMVRLSTVCSRSSIGTL